MEGKAAFGSLVSHVSNYTISQNRLQPTYFSRFPCELNTGKAPIIYRRTSPEDDTFPWKDSVVKNKIQSIRGFIFVKNGVCYAYFTLVLTEGTVGNEIFLRTGLYALSLEGFYVMGTAYDGNLVQGTIQSYIYINGNGNWFIVAPPNLNIMFSFSYPILE